MPEPNEALQPEQSAAERRRKWLRILLWSVGSLLAAVILLVTLICMNLDRIQVMAMARQLNQLQRAGLGPKALADQSEDAMKTKFVDFAEFEIPVPESARIIESKEKIGLSVIDKAENVSFVVIRDESGFDVVTHADRLYLLSIARKKYGDAKVKKILGKTMDSDVAYFMAALYSDTSRASWWMSQEDVIRDAELFPQKALETFGIDKHAENIIDTPTVRGIQLGDPVRDNYVELHLFFGEEKYLSIGIRATSKDGPHLTQARINTIVQGIRLAPGPQS